MRFEMRFENAYFPRIRVCSIKLSSIDDDSDGEEATRLDTVNQNRNLLLLSLLGPKLRFPFPTINHNVNALRNLLNL